MEIKITINGLDRVQRAFARAPERMSKALRLAMLTVTRDIADHAAHNHRFKSNRGKIEDSIEHKVTGSGDQITGTIQLNPALTMTRSGKGYGEYVHDGTPPHKIRPRDRKKLRWVDGGAFVFAGEVNHPGTDPDPFIYNAADAIFSSGAAQSAFDQQIDRALQEVGG